MSKTLRKVLIISGVIILFILIVAVGGLIYLNHNADKIAGDLLAKEYAGTEISRVYNISYDDISIGLFSGRVHISNLKVSPKDTFYEAHDSLRLKYPVLFDVAVPRLSITGIDENFSLSLEEISLEGISISGPSITIINHLSKADKEKARTRKAQKQKNATAGDVKIKRLLLQAFEINKGSFSYFDRQTQKELVSAGTIRVESESLDIAIADDMQAVFHKVIKASRFSIGKISYPTADGFYVLKVGDLVNNSDSFDLSLLDFELIPQYDKMEFGKKYGSQTDRLEIRLRELKVSDFDVKRFLNEGRIYIGQVAVNGFSLSAFRDKNVPSDASRFPRMPQQSLAELSIPLDIREVSITDSEVVYEQMVVDGTIPGRIPINHINGSVVNISNTQQDIEANGPMRWDLEGDIFGEGKLRLAVEFTEWIQQPDFSFSGSVEEMDMKVFNQMIEHTDYLRIESGIIQSMSFDASANSEYVEGELLMLYDNLKITGLRKVSKKEKEELGLLSALANVVIRQFNPSKNKDGEPVKSQIFFERNKNKGIFNYLARGVISGIKSTILPSISSPKKRYIKAVEKEDKKSEREQRKEERQKKRAARKAAAKK